MNSLLATCIIFFSTLAFSSPEQFIAVYYKSSYYSTTLKPHVILKPFVDIVINENSKKYPDNTVDHQEETQSIIFLDTGSAFRPETLEFDIGNLKFEIMKDHVVEHKIMTYEGQKIESDNNADLIKINFYNLCLVLPSVLAKKIKNKIDSLPDFPTAYGSLYSPQLPI
jgi:hypothetical protein